MLKLLTATLGISTLLSAPTANAFPIVGGNGLCPAAWALTEYIEATYPSVASIGGVRADRLPDHPSGHAIDVMVYGNTALGNAINADVLAQRARFSVKYTLWQVPSHYDHVHITVA